LSKARVFVCVSAEIRSFCETPFFACPNYIVIGWLLRIKNNLAVPGKITRFSYRRHNGACFLDCDPITRIDRRSLGHDEVHISSDLQSLLYRSHTPSVNLLASLFAAFRPGAIMRRRAA
jgi:hypothetical protein